jgi:hypothetical protein
VSAAPVAITKYDGGARYERMKALRVTEKNTKARRDSLVQTKKQGISV